MTEPDVPVLRLKALPLARCIYVLLSVTPPHAQNGPHVTNIVHDLGKRKTMHKICDKACTVFMWGFSIS
jgi:hypothetical protein